MESQIPSLLLNRYLVRLKDDDFEKNIPYMYVDSVGKITVGIGHNLTDHHDQTSLPFKTTLRFTRHTVLGGDTGIPITTNKTVGRPATFPEIQNDYEFLHRHLKLGHFGAEQLAKYTTLELDSIDRDHLFEKDLTVAFKAAQKIFGEAFDKFPLGAQAGIIDLIFNTGGLAFPRLIRAVKGEGEFATVSQSERWIAAARESNRPEVSKSRNSQVFRWFMEGALPAVQLPAVQ